LITIVVDLPLPFGAIIIQSAPLFKVEKVSFCKVLASVKPLSTNPSRNFSLISFLIYFTKILKSDSKNHKEFYLFIEYYSIELLFIY